MWWRHDDLDNHSFGVASDLLEKDLNGCSVETDKAIVSDLEEDSNEAGALVPGVRKQMRACATNVSATHISSLSSGRDSLQVYLSI